MYITNVLFLLPPLLGLVSGAAQRWKGQHFVVQAFQWLLDTVSLVFDGGYALDQQPQGIITGAMRSITASVLCVTNMLMSKTIAYTLRQPFRFDAFLVSMSHRVCGANQDKYLLDHSLVAKLGFLGELGLGWFGGAFSRRAYHLSRNGYDFHRVNLHSGGSTHSVGCC